MFAHQVIEDFSKRLKQLSTISGIETYLDAHKKLIEGIKKSQHFALGDQSSVLGGPGKSMIKNKIRLFMEQPEYLRLPYKMCTLSSTVKDDNMDEYEDDRLMHAGSTKRFAFITQLNYDTLVIYLISWIDKYTTWTLQSVAYLIRTGKPINNDWMMQWFPSHKAMGLQANDSKTRCQLYKDNGNIHLIPLKSGLTTDEIRRFLNEDIGDLSTIATALQLLNCKNISTEKIYAPLALNKKRRKNGKQEIFDYHVLNVVVPSNNKRGYQEKSTPLSHNRVHLCRGHFKEYTTEHPLFGKYTGLYWWQPSVRGQNKDGIVMKDYNITTNESNLERATS